MELLIGLAVVLFVTIGFVVGFLSYVTRKLTSPPKRKGLNS